MQFPPPQREDALRRRALDGQVCLIVGGPYQSCRFVTRDFVMGVSEAKIAYRPEKETCMRYTFFLHYLELTPEDMGDDAWEEGKAAFHEYTRALDEAGVLVSAEVLQHSTSTTTVRVGEDGRTRVQDGPYADTKEQIAGTFVIDVPDLDAALAWAEKHPAARWGAIEIRPTAVRYVDGGWKEG